MRRAFFSRLDRTVKVCARLGAIERREGHSAILCAEISKRAVWGLEKRESAVFFIRESKRAPRFLSGGGVVGAIEEQSWQSVWSGGGACWRD